MKWSWKCLWPLLRWPMRWLKWGCVRGGSLWRTPIKQQSYITHLSHPHQPQFSFSFLSILRLSPPSGLWLPCLYLKWPVSSHQHSSRDFHLQLSLLLHSFPILYKGLRFVDCWSLSQVVCLPLIPSPPILPLYTMLLVLVHSCHI